MDFGLRTVAVAVGATSARTGGLWTTGWGWATRGDASADSPVPISDDGKKAARKTSETGSLEWAASPAGATHAWFPSTEENLDIVQPVLQMGCESRGLLHQRRLRCSAQNP